MVLFCNTLVIRALNFALCVLGLTLSDIRRNEQRRVRIQPVSSVTQLQLFPLK